MRNLRYIVANWKMNLDARESKTLAQNLIEISNNLKQSELWLAPSFTALHAVAEILSPSRIKLGAQNVHSEIKGAYTGEISVNMLKEFSCTFAIIGHSERRHQFAESIELANKRGLGALAQGLGVIFCVGETLEEREQGRALAVIEAQLSTFLEKVPETRAALLIAYEPVWAIGTGKVASLEDIAQAHTMILKLCKSKSNLAFVPVLYGGSVTPENFDSILALPEVSGGLIGGASLEFKKLAKLVEIAETCKS